MILKTRNYGDVEYFAFALTDMVKWGYSQLRGVGSPVSETNVRGIPAINRAARIRAEALASLKLRCWRGEGPGRERADNVWQARLFSAPANEWQTRFGFWEAVGESLAFRNNAYIWKMTDPVSARIIEWYALHPDQVECKGAGRYKVKVRDGYVDPVGRGKGDYDVDYETILHIRGHGQGGMWEAPSPIQLFRDTFYAASERKRHEGKTWAKGTSIRLAVQFPEKVSKEQIDEWRPAWKETYEGADGETTAVIGGGAELKPIGMTMKDAQFVEMANLTVQDAALIMGVPMGLMVSALGESQPDLEQDLSLFLRMGLGRDLDRIESHLEADYQLFPSLGRTLRPMFETEGFVRGDVMTEDTIAHQQIQDGRLLVDEWRAQQGLKPLPGGMGRIPQIVPVGGGPNPQNNGNGNGAKAPATTPA